MAPGSRSSLSEIESHGWSHIWFDVRVGGSRDATLLRCGASVIPAFRVAAILGIWNVCPELQRVTLVTLCPVIHSRRGRDAHPW